MGLTGAELMGGMGDMKDILQPIVIRAINTESLSQRDPAPGPVSTLTGPLPGQNHIMMYSFIYVFGLIVLSVFKCLKTPIKVFIFGLLISLFVLFCRQGYPDEYNRANRSAYNDYFAGYKSYDYGGMSY